MQILDRASREALGFFGGHGGHGVDKFYHIHGTPSDSKGNVHLGESFGERAMRWVAK